MSVDAAASLRTPELSNSHCSSVIEWPLHRHPGSTFPSTMAFVATLDITNTKLYGNNER